MILNEKTKKEFGYTSEDLSYGSKKKIWLQCDYCRKEYHGTNKNRNNSNKVLDKDCCMGCRHKKREEMSLLKHGVKNPFQREDVKKKIRATNLDKYGNECAIQSEEVKAKAKQTMMDRYGVKHSAQSPEIREKTKQTCLDRYGVENPSSVEEFKEKRKETNLEKYGHEYYLGSEDCIDKMREKLGVDNPFQSEDVKNKIRQTHLENYGVDHHLKVPEAAIAVAAKSKQTMIDKGIIKSHKGKSISDWAKEVGFSHSHFHMLVNKYGWDYAIRSTPRESNLEKMMSEFLDSQNIEYQKQVKFDNQYADFVVGDFVIETDGLYWHSDYKEEDNDYHVKKMIKYEDAGYKPLFFRQDELLNNFEIVKSIILNKLGKSNRVFARKLAVSELGSKLANQFFESNHLMGKGRGDTYILYDGHKVLSAMRMVRRRRNDWEISRFCSLLNHSVVGGFSRLLSFFTKEENPDSVTTFIDRRYGSGEYLSGLGFEMKSCYKSFRWTNGTDSFHRMKFPSQMGYDNGLAKIWDCGQAKWLLKTNNGV